VVQFIVNVNEDNVMPSLYIYRLIYSMFSCLQHEHTHVELYMTLVTGCVADVFFNSL